MKKLQILPAIASLLCLLGLTGVPLQAAEGEHGADHGEHAGEDASDKGPNSGKLLHAGDLTLELGIFEHGVPPEYRAWISRNGEAITSNVDLTVELTRLGSEVDSFPFTYEGEYWLGKGVVTEPHSFDVAVTLELAGRQYQWQWESHEGRTRIDADMAEESGIRTAQAGAGSIERSVTSYGRLVPDPDRIARVTGRFPGQVTSVAARLGASVTRGDTLATIESNDSLQSYALRAPIGGTVIDRNTNVGELSSGQTLFTIVDLGILWAELNIFPGQRDEVTTGQAVRLNIDGKVYRSEVADLIPSPGNAPHVIARVAVGNDDAMLSPGQLLNAEIIVEAVDVPLVVDNRAIQSFRDWSVVFIQVGDTYEIRPLESGRSDGRYTEVLSGLNPGDTYVVENSYLIKADIEKAGASHDH